MFGLVLVLTVLTRKKMLFNVDIDRWELRKCVKLTREIFQQSAFDEFRGEELQPGNSVSCLLVSKQNKSRLPM